MVRFGSIADKLSRSCFALSSTEDLEDFSVEDLGDFSVEVFCFVGDVGASVWLGGMLAGLLGPPPPFKSGGRVPES